MKQLLSKCTALLFVVITFVSQISCQHDSDDNDTIIVVDKVSPTAFTALVKGTFNNVSYEDLSKSKKGILYCPKSDDADGIFSSWKNGNDNPNCTIFRGGKVRSDNIYEVTLNKLKSDTEYSYCLFYESYNNKERIISDTKSFKTNVFKAQPKITIKDDNIRFYSAISICEITDMDNEDSRYCSLGFIYSTNPDFKTDSIIKEKEITEQDNSIEWVLNNLKINTKYYCKAYLYAPHDEKTIYSDETYFMTRNDSEMIVDMGLSVDWAAFFLGAQEVGQKGDNYHWGEIHPTRLKDSYTLYDRTNDTFLDIGNDISGTEYDAARIIIGEGWHIPTKEEAQELADNCSISVKEGDSSDSNTNILVLTSNINGNKLYLPLPEIKNWNKGSYSLINSAQVIFQTSSSIDESSFYIFTQNFSVPMYKQFYNYQCEITDCWRFHGIPILPVHNK